MVVLRHRRTSCGASRANRNTLVGSGNPNNDSSQSSRSDGVNSTGPLSQNSDVSTRQPTSRQRGRKRRATTELRVPPHGHRVGLEPEGDRQFKYADPNSKHYKYNMQLGIILKREHPGIIEKKEGDIVIKTCPALEWSDYYDNDTLDDKGQTAADHVKEVFWNLFEVHVKDDEDPDKVDDDADRVLDNYAMKKVRDMMYQLRVDAVKFYFEKQGERLDDTSACSKELEYAQYLDCRIPWLKEHAWPHLCAYWCSKTFQVLKEERAGIPIQE